MKMKNKVHQLNLRYIMYIYLICFNILVTYTFGMLSYTKLIFKKTKKRSSK